MKKKKKGTYISDVIQKQISDAIQKQISDANQKELDKLFISKKKHYYK